MFSQHSVFFSYELVLLHIGSENILVIELNLYIRIHIIYIVHFILNLPIYFVLRSKAI